MKIKKETQNYNLVDLLKFLCAILVVGIHTKPFKSIFILDIGFFLITRLAVPIFFTYSGFFLFKKEKLEFKIFFNYIKKIFLLYFFWCLLYTPIFIKKNNFFDYILDVLLGKGVIHLWFLHSLIVGLFITYTLKKIVSLNKILIISLFFLLMGLVFSTYSSLFSNFKFYTFFKTNIIYYIGTRNGIFYAFPYVTLGLYISKNINQKKYNIFNSIKTNIIIFMFFQILFLIETFLGMVLLRTETTILWLCMFPLTFVIVNLSLLTKLNNKKIYQILRRISLSIYTSHMFFVILLKKNGYHEFQLFLLSTIGSIFFSILVYTFSKKTNIKLLKYLN